METVQDVLIDRINSCLIPFYKAIISSLTVQCSVCVELTTEFII